MEKKKKKKKPYRILRIIAKTILGFIVFIFLLFLFVRSHWGQEIIKNKLISSISQKTDTTIEVEDLFITFSGNIYMKGLYLEDQNGDTLVYSKELEADVPLWPIIRGKDIKINSLVSSGFTANISRQDSIGGFNYEFLLEALAPVDSTAVTPTNTTTAKRNFIIDEIKVTNFNMVFDDQVAGMVTSVRVGTLGMTMEIFDLVNLKFHASEALLSDSEIFYKRTKPFPVKAEDEEIPLPYLIVDELHLENVDALYESVPDGILADMDIGNLSMELPQADLSSNIIEVQYIHLKNSDISLVTSGSTTQKDNISGSENEGVVNEDFNWPAWDINIQEIILENNDISYNVEGSRAEKGIFNPEAMEFINVNLAGKNIFLGNEEAGATLEGISFKETSGIAIIDSGLSISINEENLDLDNLIVNLNDNKLHGNLRLGYSSLQDFIKAPERSEVRVDLSHIYLVTKDIFLFQPTLRSNDQIRSFAEKNLYGQLQAHGTLASIQISSSNLNWGNSTRLRAKGGIHNLLDVEQIAFNFPSLDFKTTRTDIRRFLNEDSLGIKIPADISVTGTLKGNMEEMEGDVALLSSEGKITAKGNFSNQGQLAFDADVQVLELDLGEILQNTSLGNLSLTVSASGEGANINELNASLQSHISSFQFNGYPINNVDITGEVLNGRGPIYAEYRDENLDLTIENFLILDSIASQLNTNLDVAGANLQALGLTSRFIRVGFGLDASFRGDLSEFDLNAEIVDGVTVYGNKSYLLGDFFISARVRSDSTALDIVNQLVDVNLRSNADPASFSRAILRHYRSYLSNTVETDTVENPVNLQLHAEIRENPILEDVFFAQLDELDTVQIAVDFNERDRELIADIDFPFISYMGSEIDSLSLYLDSNRSDFNFSFGFNSINAGPVAIKKTSLEGAVVDKILRLDFNSLSGENQLYHLQSEMTRRSDTVTLSLNPSEVIINSEPWEVPATNMISVASNFMAFQDFRLTRNNQSISITDDIAGIEKKHIAMSFNNFSLASFLGYFNQEEPLAAGDLNGSLIVENPFGSKGLLADVEIVDFEVLEVPLGILRLNAEALSYNDYNFDLAIKDGNVDLDLTGGFTAAADGAEWYTQLDLNRVEMEIIEAFSFGELKNVEGSFSGSMDLTGTFIDPEYSGQLVFKDAGFTVSKLNAPFKINQETLIINTDKLVFDHFEIEDENSNLFIVDGEILTAPLLNPEFDLAFSAEDFTILNSTREDNDLLYGKAVFDLEAILTGTLNVPNLELDLEIGGESNLTYIIPESEIGIEQRDGIVIFVNRENPDAILTATEKQSFALSGIEINSTISLNEDAVFNIIIDEQTGDNLRVTGEGDLLFNIYSNGMTNLTGHYEMSGGHYEMNLYGLVNRTFEIVEGSSITWAGDPFDAHLDLRASYSVKASASDLMAPSISGAETSVRNRFRQELPFLVYLDVGGELMQPVLNFGLDMPEDVQGAIGGQVYGRVQQINQQEQELNQQVFSLLVLNRFYPSSGTDGSGGGTLNIARDNLNEALSDQLNVISGNLIGEDSDFIIDFGLDSYTDYQGESPRERTQLDITAERAFMGDRLIARVGSEVDIQGSAAPGEESPLIGNVSLEYLIDETGTWRLRGFRSNRFENVIEGQVIVSGLAVIFQKEFNKFRELIENIKKETVE